MTHVQNLKNSWLADQILETGTVSHKTPGRTDKHSVTWLWPGDWHRLWGLALL